MASALKKKNNLCIYTVPGRTVFARDNFRRDDERSERPYRPGNVKCDLD